MADHNNITMRLHKRQGEVLLSAANEILYGGAAGGGERLDKLLGDQRRAVPLPHRLAGGYGRLLFCRRVHKQELSKRKE